MYTVNAVLSLLSMKIKTLVDKRQLVALTEGEVYSKTLLASPIYRLKDLTMLKYHGR